MTERTEADEVLAIERLLRAAGIHCGTFQAGAGVSSSTWHRIKTGAVVPNGATMRKIRAELDRLKLKVQHGTDHTGND